ncbi:MAG: hypothetical protein AB4426_19590 [Xenococcaceae cyanobacterium]
MTPDFLQKTVKHFLFGTTIAALAAITHINPAFGQQITPTFTPQLTNLSYQRVNRGIGSQMAIDVEVYPGRATAIDFSQTNEIITYIGLGDASRVVFNTDTELNSGTAKTIFLRPIQPLAFPGATTAPITNLVVKTIDPERTQRLYNFQILHSVGTPTHLGVQIVPGIAISPVINIGQGRSASLDDVETGLQVAIQKGYTTADDPVVFNVREFIAIARNQETTLASAAKLAGVELSVIIELAKIAFEIYRPSPAELLPTKQPEVPSTDLEEKQAISHQHS